MGARICVEFDILNDPIEGFPLVIGQNQHWQKVIYENPRFYCKKSARPRCLIGAHENGVSCGYEGDL